MRSPTTTAWAGTDVTGLAILLVVAAAANVVIFRTLSRALERAHADHEDTVEKWGATIASWKQSNADSYAREQQLVLIVTHMGKAVEHAINGDHDLVMAVMQEVTTSRSSDR